ncbi:hypothetical protein K1T71_009127 [Dendrolimus kikuchii]|uniref:Uncharacterized protein n=1 Tax=Dendrolimus kikuchii TaxID=765133 RepID=A0ACC1CTS1_9NEOP|nr:hypothetical protein K1T71_009127 [Dendrolimus kikuchii]
MKYFCVLLFLLEVNCFNGSLKDISNSYIRSIADKRELWIWGVQDPKETTKKPFVTSVFPSTLSPVPPSVFPSVFPLINSTGLSPHSKLNDTKSCDPFTLTKPKFTGRISEIKCQEYIWELKYDAKKRIHDEKCEQSKTSGAVSNTLRVEVGEDQKEYSHACIIGWKTIYNTWKFYCGCSLISHNFVLTAAHCSNIEPIANTVMDTVPKIVKFMTTNLKNPVVNNVGIAEIKVHRNYIPPSKYFDIALMRLEKEILFNEFAIPACLWTKSVPNELRSGIITQSSLLHGSAVFEDIQIADVDIVEDNVCNPLLRKFCDLNWCQLTDNQFCAGNLTGAVDVCQGDSGGPLQMINPQPDYIIPYDIYYVFGVSSFKFKCAEPEVPGVYTKVSSFINWIETIVWP